MKRGFFYTQAVDKQDAECKKGRALHNKQGPGLDCPECKRGKNNREEKDPVRDPGYGFRAAVNGMRNKTRGLFQPRHQEQRLMELCQVSQDGLDPGLSSCV
jgi:hypothetical protein